MLTNAQKKKKREAFKNELSVRARQCALGRLTQESLVSKLRQQLLLLPDKRYAANIKYSMIEAGLAAFSVFFMQLPSFLAQQKLMLESRGECNAFSLFGLKQIPSDNHIRNLLDPISPEHITPLFDFFLKELANRNVLDVFRSVNNLLLVALDGVHYFASNKLSCDCCQQRKHKDGTINYSHAAVAAAVVSPNSTEVISLAPEFITPQDGHTKQDCELAAAKRWLETHAEQYQSMNIALLGDDLYAHQPFCELVLAKNCHFIFNCKPDSHKTLYDWVNACDAKGCNVFTQCRYEGKKKFTDSYRFMKQVPIRDSEDSLLVNWFELVTTDEKGKVNYHNSFITDLDVGTDNVVELVRSARARWCIENEHNNILKNRGYHLEHNFGHGKKHLSQFLFTLNLLSFLFHTVLALQCPDYQELRETIGTRERFFHSIQVLTEYIYYPSWQALINFMKQGLKEKHRLINNTS